MQIVKRTEVTIPPDRQRSEVKKEPLSDLVDSILSIGLMCPPICHWDGQTWNLVAGYRRLAALDKIAESGTMIRCQDQLIMPGEIPLLILTELDSTQLFQAELEENIIREPLDWQDRVRAIAKLHELRKQANPTQSVNQTAIELAEKSGQKLSEEPAQRPGGKPTVRAPSALRAAVSEASVVAKHLDDPAIAKARNEREAYQLVLKRESAKFEAELIRRKQAAASQLDCTIRQGDMFDLLPQLEEGKFDLLLCDPPYGIGAGGASYRKRTVQHHNYEDTPELARDIIKALLTEGWRLCKPKANIFIFTDIKHWPYLQQMAGQMGWTPWPWPLIWHKSEHEGLVGGWGSRGFARTYEMIFWATKGQRGLNRLELDVLTEKRVARNKRIHGAEKPLGLMEHLIDLTTLPGDWILDPCVGSGTTVVAAKRQRRHALGIELDKTTADEALVRLSTTDEPSPAPVGESESEDAELPELED